MLNIGSGHEISIKQLAELICDVVGVKCELVFDVAKPDGVPRKLLDTTRLHQLGWKPAITLENGITSVYNWYKNNV